MKLAIAIRIPVILAACGIATGFSQGFTNLNFEMANVSNVPTNQNGADVSVTDGMLGWSASYVDQPNLIGHNNFSAGGAFVAIEGPTWPSSQILQGNYTAYVIGSQFGPSTSAYIDQIGQIPLNSMSIQFYVNQSSFATFQVTFGGNLIQTTQIGTGPNYYIFGGDVSSYAGMSGDLRFTALPDTGGFLDNIMFSTSPVPEPGTLALMGAGAGAVLLGLRRGRPRSSI